MWYVRIFDRELDNENSALADSISENENATTANYNYNSDHALVGSDDENNLDNLDVKLLSNLMRHSVNKLSTHLFLYPKLDLIPHVNQDAYYNALEKGFHFVDLAKVPAHHSHRKSYFAEFREVFFT